MEHIKEGVYKQRHNSKDHLDNVVNNLQLRLEQCYIKQNELFDVMAKSTAAAWFVLGLDISIFFWEKVWPKCRRVFDIEQTLKQSRANELEDTYRVEYGLC